MPHLYCPISSWNYNVDFPSPGNNEAKSHQLIVHGKTQIWGQIEETSFEMIISYSNNTTSPYGFVNPVSEPTEEFKEPLAYMELNTDQSAFNDLHSCLLNSTKSNNLGTFIMLDVSGLEIDIDYVWPEGKQLVISGWSYHTKYPDD